MNNVNIIIWGAGDKGKWMYFRYQNELEMCKSIVYVDSKNELVSNFGLEEGVDFYMLDRLNETARYTISAWGLWMDEVVWR